MYVCATASVPIAAALVYAGMPPAAALVFLIAGPASNIATIGTVYKIFGLKKLFIYLFSIIIGTIICGLFFDSIIQVATINEKTMISHEKTLIENIFAIILVILIFRFIIQDFIAFLKKSRKKLTNCSETKIFYVNGISCQNCANKIIKVKDDGTIEIFEGNYEEYLASKEN